jgi:hypothetical protein
MNQDYLVEKIQAYFPDYKIEVGASMKYSVRGNEYRLLHQTIPLECLAEKFDPADVFISMLRKVLNSSSPCNLVSIRIIEADIDCITNDYYFYLRVCLENSESPIKWVKCESEGYKLLA